MAEKRKSSVEASAAVIAKIICDTDSDYRGDLLQRVAEILDRHGKHYTASLLGAAAKTYGAKPGSRR